MRDSVDEGEPLGVRVPGGERLPLAQLLRLGVALGQRLPVALAEADRQREALGVGEKVSEGEPKALGQALAECVPGLVALSLALPQALGEPLEVMLAQSLPVREGVTQGEVLALRSEEGVTLPQAQALKLRLARVVCELCALMEPERLPLTDSVALPEAALVAEAERWGSAWRWG